MSALTKTAFGEVTLSVCSFFQSLFSILVFLDVQKCKEEEKKTYNTEYLRKEIHVTLTTSTYCQILSINTHLLGTFMTFSLSLFSPLASFAMQCVAPSGGSIFLPCWFLIFIHYVFGLLISELKPFAAHHGFKHYGVKTARNELCEL